MVRATFGDISPITEVLCLFIRASDLYGLFPARLDCLLGVNMSSTNRAVSSTGTKLILTGPTGVGKYVVLATNQASARLWTELIFAQLALPLFPPPILPPQLLTSPHSPDVAHH